LASDLIATTEVEIAVQSGLPDATLEKLYIDPADAEIQREAGPHDGERKVVLRLDPYSRFLYLPRPASEIETITEWGDHAREANGAEVTNFEATHGGRSVRRITGYWMRNVAVTYSPEADNARRVQVLVDLVKWELARRGYTRERTGQYEVYTGSEAEKNQILGRLRQNYAGGGLLA